MKAYWCWLGIVIVQWFVFRWWRERAYDRRRQPPINVVDIADIAPYVKGQLSAQIHDGLNHEHKNHDDLLVVWKPLLTVLETADAEGYIIFTELKTSGKSLRFRITPIQKCGTDLVVGNGLIYAFRFSHGKYTLSSVILHGYEKTLARKQSPSEMIDALIEEIVKLAVAFRKSRTQTTSQGLTT